MKIPIYKQIGSLTAECQVKIVDEVDENNNVVSYHYETAYRDYPMMGIEYEEVSEEEFAKREEKKATLPDKVDEINEILSDMSDLITILTEVISND